MCRSFELDAWKAAAIRHLVDGGAGQLELLIVDSGQAPAPSPLSKVTSPHLAWRAFNRITKPRALEPVDLSETLAGVDTIRCAVTRKGRHSEFFSKDDVAAIRAYDLDFILRFGFGIIRGEILDAARYGVWSFHHGDELRYRGGPPCFWELYGGDPVTGAILQRLTDRLDAGVVLRKGFLKTIDYSYARTVDQVFFESAQWPALVAREIANGITDHVEGNPSVTTAPIYKTPSAPAIAKLCTSLVKNAGRRFFERRREIEWNVGVTNLKPADVLGGAPITNVRWTAPVDGGWLADPIALAENGHVHVLCEHMSLASGKAKISALTFDGKQWTEPAQVLDPGTHSSYPYVFQRNGEVYCVPETFEANEVRLYRAVEFPRSWELVSTLLSGIAAVDSTIFEYDGRLWLFFTTREASATRLYAYHARDLMGPWVPHLRNPVKIDVRGSRPAGPPIVHDGVLYRPSQDSSRLYGGRIVIQRVRALSPSEFYEEPYTYVEPDPAGPYYEGLHTICFAGNYCIIDGRRPRRVRTARSA